MPIRVRASIELGIVIVEVVGDVSLEESGGQIAAFLEREELALLPAGLIDMTRVGKADGPSEIVRFLARHAAEHVDPVARAGSKMAVVADNDELFGLGRMYEMHREGSPVTVRVFRDLGEAERWLSLPEGYADRLEDVLDSPS